MFYFLPVILSFRWGLVAAAVIPAILLMLRVYRLDRLEHESRRMLRRLVIAGVLSTLLAMLEERIGEALLSILVSPSSAAYDYILYFVIVALAEESSKYLALRRVSWRSPEFDCQYDGVVYAIFVSLGFALWENIQYVLTYGFSTAIVRAITAVPGHACFGVFMGIFYGIARKYTNWGHPAAGFFRFLSVAVPVVLHGAYDYIASSDDAASSSFFVIFVAVMFGISFFLVRHAAKNDRYL